MFGSKQFLMPTTPVVVGQPISNLVVGTKVKTTYNGSDLVFIVADKNHTGYPNNSVTLITESILFNKCFDSREVNSTDFNRRYNGNNRYLYSNLLQWLNSLSASAWYSAKHSTDSPPSSGNTNTNPYDTVSGFLTGFGNNFINALQNTACITAKNTVIDGGASETVTSKFYLASNTEVGLTNENNIVEGVKLALFSDNTSRIAKYNGNVCYWWLRTPYATNSCSVRIVYTSGGLDDNLAYNGDSGVRPLCNVLNTTQVNSTPDANGIYTIL